MYYLTVMDRDGGDLHTDEFETAEEAHAAGIDWEDHPAYGSYEVEVEDKYQHFRDWFETAFGEEHAE